MAANVPIDPPQRRINRRTFAVEIAELSLIQIGVAAVLLTVTQRGILDSDAAATVFMSVILGSWLGVRWATVARLRDLDRSGSWSLLPLAAWIATGCALPIVLMVTAGVDADRLVLPFSWIWIAPAGLLTASIIALLLIPGTGDNRYAPQPQPRFEWVPWRTNRATYTVQAVLMFGFAALITTLIYLWVGRGGELIAVHVCVAVVNLATFAPVLIVRLRDAERRPGSFTVSLALIAGAEALRIWAVANGEWQVLALVGALWVAAVTPPALFPTAGSNEYGPATPAGVEWRKLFFWFSPWPQSAITQRLRRESLAIREATSLPGRRL